MKQKTREKCNLKGKRGITLIALVVTIVVLLILAGISLNLVLGNNGMIFKAKEAREKTIVAQEKEEIALAVLSIRAEKLGDSQFTAEELKEELIKNTNKNIEVSGEGTLEVEYKDTNHIYELDANGIIKEMEQRPKVEDATPGVLAGDGSESSPYQVQSIEDLVTLSKSVEGGETYYGKYFELTIDLDFKSKNSYVDATRTDMGDINGNGKTEQLRTELTTGTGFRPIGYCEWEAHDTYYFDGIFDGNGHSIANLYQNLQEYRNLGLQCQGSGLFGQTDYGLVVKNLNMEYVNIIGGRNVEGASEEYESGAILGTAWEDYSIVIIENCTVSGMIRGDTSRVRGIGWFSMGNC